MFPFHRSDIRGIVTTLLHSNVADVNSTVSERDLRTSLHLAAAMGNLPVAQILIWVKSLIHNALLSVVDFLNFIDFFEFLFTHSEPCESPAIGP